MCVFGQINNIYQKLDDRVSKDIFKNRLLFSLSGDRHHLYEMVRLEMNRYGDADIMVRLLKWIEEKSSPIVIFGAGCAGQQIVSVLQFASPQAFCFVDNNSELHGKKVMGLQVFGPEKIREIKECRIIIGTNFYVQEIKEQLLGMDIDADRIFVPMKSWWLGTDVQYFDHDIMKAHTHESFIDGGALDGGDSAGFMEWCNGAYDAVYLFEPDAENYKKLLPMANSDKRITLYEEGLWNGQKELKFSAGNKEKCAISENGNTVIKVTSIDEKLRGVPVSVIKMDIEGSEMKALGGAEQTIKKYKPRLAICVYHKPEDIIEIPLKVLELNPDYKLYLRHYSYMHTETVLYAV